MNDKMHFNKIAFEGEGEALKVQLYYHDLSAQGGHEVMKFGCDDPPKDSFIRAMKLMADHAKFFCQFPEGWVSNIKVLSVNLSWVRGKMKASLTCTNLLYNCVEFKFTTPIFAEVLQADDDPTVTLPEDVIKSIRTLLGQARKYVKGERSQIPLPLDGKKTLGKAKGEAVTNGKQTELGEQPRDAGGRFGSKKS